MPTSVISGLRHRHALVAPLFVLMALASLGPTVFVSTEQASANSSTGWQVMESGTAVLPLEAAHVDLSGNVPALIDGALLVQGQGRVDLDTPWASLRLVDGAAYIRFSNGTLTVVALSSPVTVQIDTQRTVVPVGRQWSGKAERLPAILEGWQAWWAARRSEPVPESFLRSHRSLLRNQAHGPVEVDGNDVLLLLHPAHRTSAWQSLQTDTLDPASRALLLLSFPLGDVLPEAAPGSVVDHYTTFLGAGFLTLPNPGAFLEVYRQELSDVIDQLHERGYVQREQAYQALHDQLTAQYALESSSVASLSLASSAQSSAAAQSSVGCETREMSADEALEEARAFLDAMQAAFTVQTRLDPRDHGSVHVDSIVAVTAAGDSLLSFDLDLSCQRVEHIEQDGSTMPYNLSFDSFTQWLGH